MADKLIVGIDVSKDWLDLCASNAAGVERIANTPEVVAAWLERAGAGLIAFEPTGGYERTLLEAELADAVAAHPQTAELAKLLQTIFGIGPVVAITLIADLPELGLLSAKQIAALVGLAPHTKRSGKTRYRETTGHGRPGIRRVLFNAARAAVRHPSLFKDFYDRLRSEERRVGKVALTAVMRKILITANAVARDHEPWHGRLAAGTPCRPHAEQTDHRAGRVKAAAAR